MFAAGLIALGVGVATGSPADGEPAGTAASTPVSQTAAPATPRPELAQAPASATPAVGPPVPAPAHADPLPPANPAPAPPAPAAPSAPQRAAPMPTPAPLPLAPRAPGQPVAPQPPGPPPVGADELSGMEQKLYVLQNAHRNANNLASLQLDPRLVTIARSRANDMVARNYFSHTSPTGETAFTLLSQSGYLYTIAGENIARNNYPEAEAANVAMDGYLNSQSHKENVMDGRFKNVGIGVALGPDGMKYFAVVFAS